MDWLEISDNWVLIPPQPKGIVHFLGGAFVASAPHLTYRWLLEQVARQGYAVVATPFVNTLDHGTIARDVLWTFEDGLEDLFATRRLKRRGLPIYGMGHSMGCKLHLLIGSLYSVRRAGNILISFNNYAARQSIPLVEQLSSVMPVEFTPTPDEMNRLIRDRYQVRRNLLVRFSKDTIDQTAGLHRILDRRFPGLVTLQQLGGDHQTPLGQDMSWPVVGEVFTPIDALSQWLKQEMYRDLYRLKREVLQWLNPLAPV
ncbi:DUF1350 family protein [Lyngbya sp. CCY1209]|uniref:DUF1350 family protein n=1 Tax=Lyngbya sp. CCY1209 TaxID=2886103 RepID=UPI002D21719B|nr:DUF1350 family protein [Lyngbya sp. CCY1209]MEB3884937.1 DUF1350 family protein [Lyngbya sp. CCY1209]